MENQSIRDDRRRGEPAGSAESGRAVRKKRLSRRERERRRRRRARRRQQRLHGILTLAVMAVAVAAVFLLLMNLVTAGGRRSAAASTVESASADSGAESPADSAGNLSSGTDTGGDGSAPSDTESAGTGGASAESGAGESAGSAAAGVESLFFEGYQPDASGAQPVADQEVVSPYAVLINLDTGKVIGARDADAVISPASMTKIMTILVAAEHVRSLDDTFTITQEISDYVYQNDCSTAGFLAGDTMTVRDLMYGTILPSGADASLGLATALAGSQEAFVELMNQKAEELGLSGTAHFTSCIGIYNEDNHCTVTDMAMILKAALENELAREVLSAHTYTTGPTAEHPEGITLSNWFLRRIEDKDAHGTVVAAKTGFVAQSGNCAASYNEGNDGGHYICVTAGANSSWRCIYDHVAIYQEFLS
jgi:D-alanyl-D-alanine carboxypeptidase (penicillin-binding protein 5/6)